MFLWKLRIRKHIVGGLMIAQKYTVLIEPAEEGGFVAKCLELPVTTQGETKQEALANIKEAIDGYLEVKSTF